MVVVVVVVVQQLTICIRSIDRSSSKVCLVLCLNDKTEKMVFWPDRDGGMRGGKVIKVSEVGADDDSRLQEGREMEGLRLVLGIGCRCRQCLMYSVLYPYGMV